MLGWPQGKSPTRTLLQIHIPIFNSLIGHRRLNRLSGESLAALCPTGAGSDELQSRTMLVRMLQGSRGLRTIDLSRYHWASKALGKAAVSTIAALPQLEHLVLDGCAELEDADAAEILLGPAARGLVFLSLSGCCRLTDATLQLAAARCPRLVGLRLRFCQGSTGLSPRQGGPPPVPEDLPPQGMSLLGLLGVLRGSSRLGRLQELDLSNWTALDSNVFSAIASGLPLLRRLVLASCATSPPRKALAGDLLELLAPLQHLRDLVSFPYRPEEHPCLLIPSACHGGKGWEESTESVDTRRT